MELAAMTIEPVVEIDKLVAFHYQELPGQFSSQGQPQPFWEMVYVDKGELVAVSDAGMRRLMQGDVVLHPPGERRGGTASACKPPNLLVIGFECGSAAIGGLRDKTFRLGDSERRLLAEMMREGMSWPAAAMSGERNRKPLPPLGWTQLVKNQLEILLIQLLRKGSAAEAGTDGKLSSVQKEQYESGLVQNMIQYIERTDMAELSLDRICRTFALSRNHLGVLFKRATGCSVMEYVRRLKIDRAKALIREEACNYTEIAERLGYSSIHYFSKDFKKWTGTAPSEYAKSLKARVGLR